jgi:hypothetical protein
MPSTLAALRLGFLALVQSMPAALAFVPCSLPAASLQAPQSQAASTLFVKAASALAEQQQPTTPPTHRQRPANQLPTSCLHSPTGTVHPQRHPCPFPTRAYTSVGLEAEEHCGGNRKDIMPNRMAAARTLSWRR